MPCISIPTALAVAGTATSIAGAAGAFAPSTPSPSGSAASSLASDISMVPSIYGVNQQYDPMFSALANNTQYQTLFGGNGAPGTISMMQQASPALTALGTQENSAVRASNVADVTALAPGVRSVMQSYNPGSAGLLSTLTDQAQQQLNLNGALDPFTKTAIAQDVNSGTAARGLGTGTTDAAAVAFAENAQRTQNRASAQQLAGNTITANNNFYSDPFTAVLGGGGTQTVPSTSGTVTSAGGTPNVLNMIPSSVSSLYNQTAGYANNAQVAGYNSQQQSMAGIPNGLMSIYNSYNSGAGGYGSAGYPGAVG